MRTRTPSPASLPRYLETATRTRPISPDTSSVGRFQFSDEKAKTVRYSMPRSAQAWTVRTSASTPCLWPKKRGMCRFIAQRPLPSMTMATWRGTRARCPDRLVMLPPRRRRAACACRASDRHDLGFLRRGEPLDLGDGPVGELLQVVERAPLLVLGDRLVLRQ